MSGWKLHTYSGSNDACMVEEQKNIKRISRIMSLLWILDLSYVNPSIWKEKYSILFEFFCYLT